MGRFLRENDRNLAACKLTTRIKFKTKFFFENSVIIFNNGSSDQSCSKSGKANHSGPSSSSSSSYSSSPSCSKPWSTSMAVPRPYTSRST
jgi:hypothetical protein